MAIQLAIAAGMAGISAIAGASQRNEARSAQGKAINKQHKGNLQQWEWLGRNTTWI